MSTTQRTKFIPGVTSSGKLPGITNLEEQKANGTYNLHFVKIDKIQTNKINTRYEQIDIQSLAISIMTNGLYHNLVTTAPDENGIARLISGERRLRACRLIREEYPDEFKKLFPNEMLPCKVMENLSEVDEEIALIEANAQVRTLTLESRLDDITRLMELYQMRNETGKRVSKQVADSLKMSERQVYKYISLSKLNPIILKAWTDNIITINMASEIAGFGETEQLMLAEVLQEEHKLTDDDIQAAKELSKKKQEAEERLDYAEKKLKTFEELKEKAASERERDLAQSKINEIQSEQSQIKTSMSRAELKRVRMVTRSNKVIDKLVQSLDKLDELPDASKELPEVSARLELLKLKLEEAAAKL